MKAWQQTLLLGAGFGAAFLLGQRFQIGGGAADSPLLAQGRGPANPPPASTPAPGVPPAPGAPGTQPVEAPVVYSEEGGHAATANGFVAVTGSYGVGTSVLYLIDTVNRQLAVYEARGGSAEQRRIVLVGARRIDLDLQLEGYNDRSEYDYDRLKSVFEKRGRNGEVRNGLDGELPGRK
jgi:hypothetical protein